MALEKGIIVSLACGNSGPIKGTVTNIAPCNQHGLWRLRPKWGRFVGDKLAKVKSRGRRHFCQAIVLRERVATGTSVRHVRRESIHVPVIILRENLSVLGTYACLSRDVCYHGRVVKMASSCFRQMPELPSKSRCAFRLLQPRVRGVPGIRESRQRQAAREAPQGSQRVAQSRKLRAGRAVLHRAAGHYGVLEKQVLSRRAEAKLRLRRYEEPFVDAETATKIPGASDSHHARSLWCKGKSLTALQEHELALPCFQSSVALPDAPPDVSIDLERSRTYLRESRDGEYDITNFVLGRKVEPECSDYFGPLELRMTPDGRGEGVYLTRDVRRGELLIVCNPTAYGRLRGSRTRTGICTWSCYDLAALPAGHGTDGGREHDDDWIASSATLEELWYRRDIERVRRVGHRCGFTTQAGDAWIAGVWASSGFFNHSCTPNASKVCFGRVMFIRAARNMSAGDEVLLSYLEATRSMEPLLLAPLPAREKTLDEVLDLENRMTARGFSDEEKDCIRAAQVERYSAVCVLKHPELPSAGDYLRILHETAPRNFETLSKMGVLYRAAGCGDESLQLLHEEVAAFFGELRREIVDGVINQVIAQATLLDEMR
ncbi:hypothetical protein SELMODRAFT_429203 [Selaginella moellendorffii]|uniref:SET domain-containing protein n=1 Tax=Selaginella moellendorffii TaxID=88036 RepID=D8T5D5_SELML|nr:hypothetical protein SELMODRAFT_429203 [Selaginella moellendorffii]